MSMKGTIMNERLLNACGFTTVAVRRDEDATKEVTEQNLNISVVRAYDHVNPQIVFKLPREVLSKMKWEITDRVKVLSNQENKTVALVKARKDEPNSFAISTQGTSVENAIKSGRGGIVKVGWREDLCQEITGQGTYESKMKCVGGAMIVALPEEIFA